MAALFRLFLVAAMAISTAHAAAPAAERTFRILHIMSYHSPWRWTDGQLAGFKEGLGGLRAEYRVFEMDTKRNNSPAAVRRKALEARELIEKWKPDLVYTSDDDVQEHVARHYVNTDLPFVFSGVNKDPAVYGFTGSRNITGVLEQEHFLESVRLLQSAAPHVKRIAVVLDEAAMWDPVVRRMRERVSAQPGVEVVAWDTIRTWEDFQRRMRAYPAIADAVGLLGIFNFKDAQGRNVPYQEVLRWTAEHSSLPDFSFWKDRVHYGTLAAVTVSEHQQGLAAGRIARGILAEGRSAASYPMLPTTKGVPTLSLARARKLGLKLTSSTLLAAEVVPEFDWNKP